MPLMRGLLSLIEQQAERIKALALRYTAAEERLAVYNSGGFADADALAAKMIEVMDRATKAERELAEAHEAYGRAFARAAQAEARAEALAKLIAEHNSSIEAACGANNEYNAKRNGCDSYLPRGRNCVDCPRDYLIDAAIRALGEGK
jgi:predicted  nucleic acid-binding Zn-ribbon protein